MKKVILVTGSSSGFGRMTALALANSGNKVYASMRNTKTRNAENAEQVLKYGQDNNLDLRVVELDVSSQKSIEEAVDQVTSENDRLDVIIHNAGHMVFGPSEAFTPRQFAELYDTNVLGAQRVNRAVLPVMRKQNNGLVVWVSSSSVNGGTPPYLGPYFAAKAAMDSLAVTYASELSRWGIETSIIVPGAYTKGTNHFVHSGKPQDEVTAALYNKLYSDLPDKILAGLKKLEPEDADPAEVATAIAKVVDLPLGKRPFRLHIDPSEDGCEVVNAVADRVRREFFRAIGIDDLMTVQ